MGNRSSLTFAVMDPPYESSRTATFFRLLDIAARRGHHIRVFAYEGAAALAFEQQRPHGNAVHKHSVDEENHPLPKDWVRAIQAEAERNGGRLEWVKCGLCADERGITSSVDGVVRGSPADFWKLANASHNVLVIPTR